MWRAARICIPLIVFASVEPACGQAAESVMDISTRPGVTQRMVVLTPKEPKAAVVLLAGGHGGLQITPKGSFQWGGNNFLVRARRLFAEQGLLVAIVDAPSDRQRPPYLSGFRQSPKHVADIKAVIAWLRNQTKVPVWLVGTSRGTESAAFVGTQLTGAEAPDGLVLTSTILTDNKETPVTAMPLCKLKIPVLVVHHVNDGCNHFSFRDVPKLMDQLNHVPKKQLISIEGGESRGDPCEAFAYHGFNGRERDVVSQIAGWILTK